MIPRESDGSSFDAAAIADGATAESQAMLARRRDEILGVVLRAQASRRAGRIRRARTLAVLGAIAVLATAALLPIRAAMDASTNDRRADAGPAIDSGAATPAGPTAQERPVAADFAIARMALDPEVLDRLRIGGDGSIQRVDDTELLDLLAAAGRPSGIIRIDGRATLSSNARTPATVREPADAPRS
ncbi:MAG: hypothetical protein U0575_14505 [Phycisphaerales bacterium]